MMCRLRVVSMHFLCKLVLISVNQENVLGRETYQIVAIVKQNFSSLRKAMVSSLDLKLRPFSYSSHHVLFVNKVVRII